MAKALGVRNGVRAIIATPTTTRCLNGRSKVHLLTDVLGRPAFIHLTPGNAGDVTAAPDVLAAVLGRRCRERPIRHDEARYRDRWRIETAICRLKDFRRVGTRCDKLAANFASAVALAAVVAFWCRSSLAPWAFRHLQSRSASSR